MHSIIIINLLGLTVKITDFLSDLQAVMSKIFAVCMSKATCQKLLLPPLRLWVFYTSGPGVSSALGTKNNLSKRLIL